MSIQYCEQCEKATEHDELIKQKPSKFGNSRKEKIKEFFSGFFAGVAVGPALASIELIDRYVVCQECGLKKLENHGEEFQ